MRQSIFMRLTHRFASKPAPKWTIGMDPVLRQSHDLWERIHSRDVGMDDAFVPNVPMFRE
ncbi:MAG: hypothetical protein ACRER8_06800 [Pseudomonas sp.]|uniref:hypothetical protein n=1 Tax=Pseudomonas sp. TaxID=306 RepID=UPI003D6F22E9